MPSETARFKELLAKNELKELIKELLKFTEHSTWRPLNSKVLSSAAQYQELNDKNQFNIISEADYQLGISKVRHTLLEVINAIADGNTTVPATPIKKTGQWKWLAAIPVVIGVLAGIVQIWDYFKPDSREAVKPNTSVITTIVEPSKKDTVEPTTVEPSTTTVNPEAPRPPDSLVKAPDTTLKIQLFSDKNGKPVRFKAGETMRFFVQVSQPCYVRCIYELATGELVLFENDLKIESSQLHQKVQIGAGVEVAAPFGKEQLYVFAQSEPFPMLTLQQENGYDIIVDGLPEALAKTRGFKKKIAFAEAKLGIETIE